MTKKNRQADAQTNANANQIAPKPKANSKRKDPSVWPSDVEIRMRHWGENVTQHNTRSSCPLCSWHESRTSSLKDDQDEVCCRRPPPCYGFGFHSHFVPAECSQCRLVCSWCCFCAFCASFSDVSEFGLFHDDRHTAPCLPLFFTYLY